MNGEDIAKMRRARKGEVLLQINEHEGTIACLRPKLVAIQENMKAVIRAIENRLSPGLLPGLEPTMTDGILTRKRRDREPMVVDLGQTTKELEDLLAIYTASYNDLVGLHRELQTL